MQFILLTIELYELINLKLKDDWSGNYTAELRSNMSKPNQKSFKVNKINAKQTERYTVLLPVLPQLATGFHYN